MGEALRCERCDANLDIDQDWSVCEECGATLCAACFGYDDELCKECAANVTHQASAGSASPDCSGSPSSFGGAE